MQVNGDFCTPTPTERGLKMEVEQGSELFRMLWTRWESLASDGNWRIL